jgi:hypothetical protein
MSTMTNEERYARMVQLSNRIFMLRRDIQMYEEQLRQLTDEHIRIMNDYENEQKIAEYREAI